MSERTVYLALGRPGTGKTRHLAGALRSHFQKRPQLTIIHDVRMGRPGAWNDDAIGCLAPEEARFYDLREMFEAAEEGNVPALCSVYHDQALNVAKLAWARAETSQQGTTIVFDELDQLPERLVRNKPGHRETYECLQYGRPLPVDIFGSIRQPQRCDPQWFACATQVALFNMSGDLQLQRIRQSGWPDCDKLSQQVPTLDQYQYILLDLPGG
jgi:hypothetical protein